MTINHFALVSVLGLAIPFASSAATKTVAMRNFANGTVMAFDPPYLQINPGDSVVFKAVDPGHGASTILTIMPAGATPFAGTVGQDVTVTFVKQGFYGIKCPPHFGMGMVALVKVGTKPASNRDDTRNAIALLPGLAKKRMADLLRNSK